MPYADRGSYRCFRAVGADCVAVLDRLDIRRIPGPQLVRGIAGLLANKHHGQVWQCLCDEHMARSTRDRIHYSGSPNTRRASEPVFLLNRKACRSSAKGTKPARAEPKVGGPFFTSRFRSRIPTINMSCFLVHSPATNSAHVTQWLYAVY